MFHCYDSFGLAYLHTMSADIRLNSHNVCVSNIHDISLKGLQVLHLQDIFVRLAIVIPHFHGNHFLSCQKPYRDRAGKNLHPNVPPIWGSFTNPLPNPFLSSSTVVTLWTRWTHGPIQKQPRSSRVQRLWVENARPNHCCNIHPGWDTENFCEQKWPCLVDIWVIPGKGWEFSPKRNPSKKSRILTKIEAFIS